MSKLLFCHYQPNRLGIKLVRMALGVPSGELGRNKISGNIRPNPPKKQDSALEKSREKEEDAKAALNQTVELVRTYSNAFLAQLAQLQGEAVAPEAGSSARSVVDHINILESKTDGLETNSSNLLKYRKRFTSSS
jgi:hypothetical protein